MSKELEELKGITRNKIEYIKKQPKIDWIYLKYYEGLLNLITRIEAIDNVNPSEALEKFDYIGNDIVFAYDDFISYDYTDDVKYIKQALIKAQEQEKMLNIIKEHLTFEDSGTEEYFDFKTNQKVKKYIFKIESKDTGATIHIHLDSPEYFNILKEMTKNG